MCLQLVGTCDGFASTYFLPFFSVDIKLGDPLWSKLPGPQEVAAEVMSYCLQLDSLILSTLKAVSVGYHSNSNICNIFERIFGFVLESTFHAFKEMFIS